MPGLADQLARLRAHLQGGLPLPPDLAGWVMRTLHAALPTAIALQQRDEHLRAAARLVPGSTRDRARAILQESARLQRRWASHQHETPVLGTFAGHVLAAQLIAKLPADRRLRAIVGEIESEARAA